MTLFTQPLKEKIRHFPWYAFFCEGAFKLPEETDPRKTGIIHCDDLKVLPKLKVLERKSYKSLHIFFSISLQHSIGKNKHAIYNRLLFLISFRNDGLDSEEKGEDKILAKFSG